MRSDRPPSPRSLTKAQLIEEVERLRERLAHADGPGPESTGAEDAERLQRELAATGEILRIIARSATKIEIVLDAIAERAAHLCEASDVVIQLVEGDQLRGTAHFGPIPAPSLGQTRPITRGLAAGRAVLDCQTVHVEDIAAAGHEFPEGSALARQQGHGTILVVPLVRGGAAIGVLLLRRAEVRSFSRRQVELLETFADQAVIAIENVRLIKELEARNRDLTATGEILQVISRSPTDAQPVFNAIVRSGMRLLEGFSATLRRLVGEELHPCSVQRDQRVRRRGAEEPASVVAGR
jgi:transcriptional regulator with GAF, ATPase, and Fis domain